MATPHPKDVFINVPFDPTYEPLFVTLLGMLVFLGQEPHCVLEVREKGHGRLKRIVQLMEACPISIHDLSRVGHPVRFNMPFELGLACALQLRKPAWYEIFVLDAVDYRLDVTLSDYKGRDPLIHRGTCDGMIGCLLDTFESDVPNTPQEFRRASRYLRRSAELLKQDLRATSMFRPALFRRLVGAATEIATERGFIRP